MCKLNTACLPLRPFFTILLIAVKCLASESHTVKTSGYGSFEFLSVSVGDHVLGTPSCAISGEISNKTDGSWTDNEFKIELLGKEAGQSAFLTLSVPTIPFGSVTRFNSYCYHDGRVAEYPNFEPETYRITFEGGYREPGPEAARKEAAAARAKVSARLAVERSKAEEVRRRRAEYLAKFSTIQSGFTSAFVGSDKKCSEQFLEAVSMDGLEKRKRLTDLIAFGCGFMIPNSTHIAVNKKVGQFASVEIVDGEKSGQSGWVPVSWIK